jgi:hypothetical protein
MDVVGGQIAHAKQRVAYGNNGPITFFPGLQICSAMSIIISKPSQLSI